MIRLILIALVVVAYPSNAEEANSQERIVATKALPNEAHKQLTAEFIEANDANIVRFKIATRLPKRVVSTMIRKETEAWPGETPYRSQSQQYIGMLQKLEDLLVRSYDRITKERVQAVVEWTARPSRGHIVIYLPGKDRGSLQILDQMDVDATYASESLQKMRVDILTEGKFDETETTPEEE